MKQKSLLGFISSAHNLGPLHAAGGALVLVVHC